MSQADQSAKTVTTHDQILHFPKSGKPSLAPNEWHIWSASQDESSPPDLKHNKNVLVPLTWWVQHHKEVDIQTKAKARQIGVWFAADDDILKHADFIEAGKVIWPLIAAHFPIFRDGRSFSTAALLRDRFGWVFAAPAAYQVQGFDECRPVDDCFGAGPLWSHAFYEIDR
jgi:uncharacterized protein (DUF934 family)